MQKPQHVAQQTVKTITDASHKSHNHSFCFFAHFLVFSFVTSLYIFHIVFLCGI